MPYVECRMIILAALPVIPEKYELSRIGRYRVMCHETFSEPTKALFREAGIDPDTLYTVTHSYDDEAACRARLIVEQARNRNPYLRYSFLDAGVDEIIAMEIAA